MKASKSDLTGALNEEAKSTELDMPSTGGAPQSLTSDTLGQTPPTNLTFQLHTKSLREEDTLTSLLTLMADRLGDKVGWQLIELGDGTTAYALCFPTEFWQVGEKNTLRLK